jgi:hypothetical protein
MVSLTNFVSLSNPPPSSSDQTPTLSPEQENDLLLIPEQFHARIVQLLATKHEDGNWNTITTVAQAHQHAIYEAKRDQLLKDIADPVVSAKFLSDVQGRQDAARIDHIRQSQSPGAIANQKYIDACQARKARITAIKLERETIRTQIKNAKSNPTPSGPLSEAHRLFNAWADAQRKACEDYIAQHKPVDMIITNSQSDIAGLQLKYAALAAELADVTAKVPQREEFL